MKLKPFAFLVIALATTANAQDSAKRPVPHQSTVQNADGTKTVSNRDENGTLLDESLLKPDGSVNRRTELLYDRSGHCMGWKSSDARNKVDSGEHYSYDKASKGEVIAVRAIDGTVIYKK